jgi:hypothetical protein
MVPEIGIEPTRTEVRWILSPLRLPVPPLGHAQREYLNRAQRVIGTRFELFPLSTRQGSIIVPSHCCRLPGCSVRLEFSLDGCGTYATPSWNLSSLR